MVSGQHIVEAARRVKLELEKRNLPPPRWCSHFLATVVRLETPLTIRESWQE